ncbi:unnamed protein product, partial [Medioppia subpectinata]
MSFRNKSKSHSSKGQSGPEGKSFQLSRNRFVSVSEFKNQMRVDVREYYTDDNGDQKPGRKGISLSMDEWNKLINFLPKIEKAIKKMDDSGDDSDDSSDRRGKHSKRTKKSDSEDLDSDNSDDKRKKSKKEEPKPKKAKTSDSEDDSDDDKRKKSKKVVSDSDSSK